MIEELNNKELRPNLETVERNLQNNQRIPVYRKFVSDTITPVSAYLSLSKGANSKGFLLESVEKGEQIARYSFLSVDPKAEIILRDNEFTTHGDVQLPSQENPFEVLKQFVDQWDMDGLSELPDFTGGLVGYLGYEMIQHIESSVPIAPRTDEIYFPDLYMYLVDKMVIFDHVKRQIYFVGHIHRDDARSLNEQYLKVDSELRKLIEKMKQAVPSPSIVEYNEPLLDRVTSNFTKAQFEESVRLIKKNIRSGEIFQAVLSQKFQVTDRNDPFNMYRRLRSLNPSPYMFYLDYQEFHLVGSSPEILVQKEGDTARVRPIAGTRHRGENKEKDDQLANELKSDEKELAEHTMLLDLGRNDLGRVCDAGSVTVTDRAYIEKYSHVMHMVSNVEGVLKKGMNAIDLIEATFPAGTVTGAPKVRAMQILNEIEPDRRGPYAGAVGYLSFQGNLDMCIVIRTILSDDKKITIQAGGGIVADSEPSNEYKETQNKAKALLEAIHSLPEVEFL